ncbi:MAG: menaquinone biosynthesis decarboxylase, partial [Chitinophagaceae bacterium]
ISPNASVSTLLQAKFNEVLACNISLFEKEIPCMIVSVKKNRVGHIKELHNAICGIPEAEGIKMILYVEHTVDANDLTTSLWRLCNNLDPKRDSVLVQRPSVNETNSTFSCIGFDGTRKTKEYDNFQRDWPNIIVADDATIAAVDGKWNELGLGELINSPSLKFKGQMYGEEAVVN